MNKQNVGIDTKTAIKILSGTQPYAMDSDYYYKKAVGLAISTLEKQTPKKPSFQDSEIFECPSCEWKRSIGGKQNYCPTCGQAIDWRNEDE